MKYLLLAIYLIGLTSCATRQINSIPQTFTDYVILNKYSDYQRKSVDDWKKQPSENFITNRRGNPRL